MRVPFFKPASVVAAIVIFVTIVSTSSCTKDATPGPNQVFMQNTAFNPSTITVAVNSTVTWTNKDNTNHNVTGASGSFNSPTIGPGATYSHQFTSAGTYLYSCTFHPGMNGTVIVQ